MKRNLQCLWSTALEKYPDRPYITYLSAGRIVSRTFKEIYDAAGSIGYYFHNNYPEGTHAALIGISSEPYIVSWFGTALSGNVCVPLNPDDPVSVLADEITRSDSEIVFFDNDKAQDKIPELRRLCPYVKEFISLQNESGQSDISSFREIILKNSGHSYAADSSENDLAAIFFTSGTTGKSKGVMLTHGNLCSNAVEQCHGTENISGRRLNVLPVHHAYAFTCDVLKSVYRGNELCINESFRKLQKNLVFYEPETVTLVPMLARVLLERMRDYTSKETELTKPDAGRKVFGNSIKIVYCGAAYLHPDIIQEYREFGISIRQGYGMTECSPVICTAGVSESMPGSVGEVIPGMQVRIDDGEICVKGHSVMKGYYNDPAETAKVFTEDGWLRTGDLGYTAESDGKQYVFITGRKKNLIILESGENVSPEEIENKFVNFDEIKEMAVYAKDGMIIAEILPSDGYDEKSVRKCVDKVNLTLPSPKRIARPVLRCSEFKKSSSGKIIRAGLGTDQ